MSLNRLRDLAAAKSAAIGTFCQYGEYVGSGVSRLYGS